MKTGLYSILVAPLSATDDTKYSKAPEKMLGAVASTPSLDVGDAKQYADNRLVASDNSVTGGKLGLEIADDNIEQMAKLLGQGKETIGSVEMYVSSVDDTPIYCGVGYIANKTDTTGAKKYEVKMYRKLQFAPYETEDKTKEEKVTYSTVKIEATIFIPEDGKYRYKNTFDTEEEAIAALTACFTVAQA